MTGPAVHGRAPRRAVAASRHGRSSGMDLVHDQLADGRRFKYVVRTVIEPPTVDAML